jgi:hypothetical protein
MNIFDIFGLAFLGLTVVLFVVLTIILLSADPKPPWGGPRVHRIIYADGQQTSLLTPLEAYGLWYVFADGPSRAVKWYEDGRLKKERPREETPSG